MIKLHYGEKIRQEINRFICHLPYKFPVSQLGLCFPPSSLWNPFLNNYSLLSDIPGLQR